MDYNFQNAVSEWETDRAEHELRGVHFDEAIGYLTPDMKRDFRLAMDAAPVISTLPNAGVPWFLTNFLDPEVVRVAFSPVVGAEVYTERKLGDWTSDTVMFNMVEETGETSGYGDFNENGRSGVNTQFPQRQPWHFQTMLEWGERQLARFDLTKMSYVAEIQRAGQGNLNRYLNFTYFFGVQGLQNYGSTNDPSMAAALTPGTKVNGGTRWVSTGGAINAQPLEVLADFQAAFYQLVVQTGGIAQEDSNMTAVIANGPAVGLTAVNDFNVNVKALLAETFPNLKLKKAVQLGGITTANPQGIAAGNMLQLFLDEFEGQRTIFASFTEKSRGHAMIKQASSFKQKLSSGTNGAIVRFPAGMVQMIGI